MNTTIWILQGVLAALFLMSGLTKSTQTKEKLAIKMPWVNDFSLKTVRFIGITQTLAGIGLILPLWLNFFPILSPLAASGLCITMLLAIYYHYGKKEFKAIGVNTVLFALAFTVVFFRIQDYI